MDKACHRIAFHCTSSFVYPLKCIKYLSTRFYVASKGLFQGLHNSLFDDIQNYGSSYFHILFHIKVETILTAFPPLFQVLRRKVRY